MPIGLMKTPVVKMADCPKGIGHLPSEIKPEILTLLEGAKKVLIFSHVNPDGDALGSSVGLAAAIAARGGQADLYLSGEWSSHLDFLLEGVSIKRDLNSLASYDLLVLLDCHSFARLGDAGKVVLKKLKELSNEPPLVVIDHHLEAKDEKAGGHWLHCSSASSAGELVWALLKKMNWSLPHNGVQALMMAVASDTGFFTQSNTTAGALQAASDLTALGGSIEELYRQVKKNWPVRRLRLMGLALNSLGLYFGNRLAIMVITPEMLRITGATMSDTDDFVEMGRNLDSVNLSALIKDVGNGPGTVKVSLRSRSAVDASSLAKLFGGGGHRQASAYNDPQAEDAESAMANLLAVAEQFL